MKRFRILSMLIITALLFSLLALFSALGRYGRAGDHFSVKEYDQFHDVLHPLEHEALPKKDFQRIRANAAELIRFGNAMVKLGVPPGVAQAEEFRTELKKFGDALAKFRQDSKAGTDSQLEASFSAVHDSFEMLVGMLPRKSAPATAASVPLSSNATFYSVRPDLRRCVSPLCGGYFVRRVNMPRTRCADGSYLAECYVAGIDWNGQPQVDARKALLRGDVIAKRYGRFGNLGSLRVAESWEAATDRSAADEFYLVRDRGLRCITFPCLTHYEAKLNSTLARNIAGVDLTGAGARDEQISQAHTAMTGADGVIVAGNHLTVTGPGGRAPELKATQFYLRARKTVSSMKPCIKTGCSGQVCADHNVMTTCEYRQEYACYQKAACERQAEGTCGFTKTPELAACLAGK